MEIKISSRGKIELSGLVLHHSMVVTLQKVTLFSETAWAITAGGHVHFFNNLADALDFLSTLLSPEENRDLLQAL